MPNDVTSPPYPEEVSDIEFYVPVDIEKSMANTDSDSDFYTIEGFATSPNLDQQNDIVPPSAIDTSLFIPQKPGDTRGHINYEHRKGGEYIIGYPTSESYVDPNKGLFVQAKLYKGMHYADAMWGLARNIAKSGSNQRLGYSIEGTSVVRNRRDRRVVDHVKITNVALTTNPANIDATWETVVKSLTTGHGMTPETQRDAAALRTESLGNSIHNLAWTLDKLHQPEEFEHIYKNVSKFLDANSLNSEETAVILLQLQHGLSRKEAHSVVQAYINNT